MASARVRQSFREAESDEDSPQQTAPPRSSRLRPDSPGDEGATRQAGLQRRPLASAGGKLKHAGVLRPEELGDLRPTTPPTGPASRSSRQADWASAVLEMLQSSALVMGPPVSGVDAIQRSGASSVSSKTSRRQAPAGGAPSHHRTSVGLQLSLSTKAAAARTLENSSSDDEIGLAKASLQAASSVELKSQVPSTSESRGPRSSRHRTITSAGPSGHVPTAGVQGAPVGANGGFTIAATAAFEGLQVNSQGTSNRQQQRHSRLRRASGNESIVSEVSNQESLGSSKQTLGSSKLSATVQRVVARQRLMDSSSGEEDNVISQKQLDPDVGQAARLLERFRSLSSSSPTSGFSPSGGVLASDCKPPTALVPMISVSPGRGAATVSRPSSAVGSARARPRPSEPQVDEVNAFTFNNGTHGGSSAISDGIPPRMRQAAAAAAAEVSAAAASSLRPLPLTMIVPARLTSPDRPKTAPQQAPREPQRAASMASTDGVGGSNAVTGAAVARRTATSAHPAHVSSSQRIATWLEQQPSLSSVGMADDVVSEYATASVTGTEIDLDYLAAAVKPSGRPSMTMAIKAVLRGDVKLPGPGPSDGLLGTPSRPRPARLTTSSEEVGGNGAVEHGCKADVGGPAVGASGRCVLLKRNAMEAEPTAETQIAEDGTGPMSVAAAKGAQFVAAAATLAARRLDFDGPGRIGAVSLHPVKDLTASYSSPSLRPSEGQLLNDPPVSPSDRPETTVDVTDKAPTRRTVTAAVGQAATHGKQRLATTSAVSPRRQQQEVDNVEGQQSEETSSPESGVRTRSGGSSQRNKVLPMATAGRLTPNELRVMLSVLSRPPWAGGPAHAVARTLSPQPSHSGDSVQSFSYSEMLQVMRAMSSSGGGGSQHGDSVRDGSKSGRAHKSSRKDSSSGMPRSTKHPTAKQLHHQHLLRSVRDAVAAHTSIDVKASHSARSFDGSSSRESDSSQLREHPMAAPVERDWSASASTVSDRVHNDEERQQRNVLDVVRLWNLLTGRRLNPESLEPLGLHLNTEGTATPQSDRPGPPSVLSGAGGNMTHSSAAVLAASAAAMATSAVMAAAAGGAHHHHNAYLQAVNLNPFSDALTAANAANQFSQSLHHQQRHRTASPTTAYGNKACRTPSAASLSRTRSPDLRATTPCAGSPAEAQPLRSKSTTTCPLPVGQKQQQDDDAPASIQADDLVRLMRFFSATDEAAPPTVSEATKNELGRLVQVLRNTREVAKGPDNSPSRRQVELGQSSSPAKQRPAVAPNAPVPAVAVSDPPGSFSMAAESPRVHAPSSRRSSADTIETGQALGRLYQSLRNLRVRDEGDQTEGMERPVLRLTSGCVQTDSVDLQASAAYTAGESGAPGTDLERSKAAAGPLQVSLPHDSSLCVQAPPDMAMHGDAPGGQSQSQLGVTGGFQAAAVGPPALTNDLIGKEARVTRVLKLPNGQLVELESLLALASAGAKHAAAVGDINSGGVQWLQASVNPTSCTDGGVRTDVAVPDCRGVLPPILTPPLHAQHPQTSAISRSQVSDSAVLSDSAPNLESDSAAGQGTSVTAAPAIAPAGTMDAAFCQPMSVPLESAAAAFQLRNLPIASEGGIMAAPNQGAVTGGRVGSAGGMLAYLEAADPTTATALLELVQALQLMTLHSRRQRWVSDGSSTASGAYLVEPQHRFNSLDVSSGGATTLRFSFGTSIGPSVSQAGHASLIDLPDATCPDMEVHALAPPVKAATTGGLADGTAGEGQQPKRQTHNAGLPPRPVLADSAQHLRRALRAVSGGGTMRFTSERETIHGVSAVAQTLTPVTPGPVAEAAKVHIARALELLSQQEVTDTDAPAAAAAASRAVADAELRAQEELIAALLVLLGPENLVLHGADGDTNTTQESAERTGKPAAAPAAAAAAITSQEQVGGATIVPSPVPLLEQPAVDCAPKSAPAMALTTSEISAVKLAVPTEASPPTSPLHARIQEVLKRAERASAGISSLQVGLSPMAPPAAEVLEGVPFEQAIGFIMDGLRDFDGGPSHLARQLHLMYSPTSGGCGLYPSALDSLASRRQTAVALGAAAVLEAVAESGAVAAEVEVNSEEPQPLTDMERERMHALIAEALAAAEALARSSQREEAWNAERLGLPVVDEVYADGQHAQARAQEGEEEPKQLHAAPTYEQMPPRSPPLMRISSSNTLSSPATRPQGRSTSVISPDTTGKPQSASTILAAPAAAAAGASVSPRFLIQHVADLGAGAMASLLPNVSPVAKPVVSSVQRSAPVTTAGVLPLMDSSNGQLVAHAALSPEPQTFGGAMDLPADRALGPAVPHSTPYLPYGDLDEQLRPIQSGAASITLTASQSLHATAENFPSGNALVPRMQGQVQPASDASMVTRLPTFATPSAPAVRSVPICPQRTTIGGTVDGGLAQHDGTSEEGWEPEMADAARICPPESSPSEMAAAGAAIQPLAEVQRRQFANIAAGAVSVPTEVRIRAATASTTDLQLPLRLFHATAGPSTGEADPEVPALTALDRYKSPVASNNPSPRLLAAAIPGGSAEALPLQSSWSVESDSNTKGDLMSVRLARDALSGQRTARPPEDGRSTSKVRDIALAGAAHAPNAGEEGHDGIGMEAAEMVNGGRHCRALFAATPEGLAQASAGVDAAAALPSAEQLLTRASQLLLQAMQRAAEGQPEQEAAFRILAPILQGLATRGKPLQLQLESLASATLQQPSKAAELAEEAGLAAAEIGSSSSDPADRVPSFTFGEAPEASPLHQQAQQRQHQNLATPADLEMFKEDVMSSVRSALVEIVDMIGSTVVQHAAAAATGPAVSGAQAQEAPELPKGPACEDALAPAGGERPMAPTEFSMPPERSASPYFASEQQEIRITRAELEAFIFGKAILGRTAADDLLGVRLRELHAPQLPQKEREDDEEAGVYGSASMSSSDPRVRRDHGRGSLESIAAGSYPHAIGSRSSEDLRRQLHRAASTEPTPRWSSLSRRGASPPRFDGALDADEQGRGRKSAPVSGSPPVPRDSPLRQPLADGADFKSLFRRSIENLRAHLQLGRADKMCSSVASAVADGVVRGISQTAQPAHAVVPVPSEELCGPSKPLMVPLPRAPGSRQPLPVANAANGATMERALSDTLEATLSPEGLPQPLARQMAAAAAVAAAAMATPPVLNPANEDDVELEPYLSNGTRPEPTIDVTRWPDPAAPAAQPSLRLQSQTRRGTADSNHDVEAIGDFLAALTEPMAQVVGVLAQQGGGTAAGRRLYPRRSSIVIEELTDEDLQLQPQPERPSRVPGFTAASRGHVVLEAEDEDMVGCGVTATGAAGRHRGSGLAQLGGPRAASEADMSRLHQAAAQEHAAAALPSYMQAQHHLHLSRSAATTPVPRAGALQPSALASHAECPAAAPAVPRLSTQHPQAVASVASRLKMPSAPGTGAFAAEDRPLSSFMSPSDGGAAASPQRRRTHSPGPMARQAALRPESSGAGTAAPSGIQMSRSVIAVASPPGTSLDELESFLRAFRTRIGTDEVSNGPAVMPLPHAVANASSNAVVATAAGAVPQCDPFRHHVVPELAAWPIADVEDVRRDSTLSESVSATTARRVRTGFNMFTIRASAASALAAAAAVEQAFSPRQERERELAAAAAARLLGSGAAVSERLLFAREQAAPVRDGPRGAVSTSQDTGSGASGAKGISSGSSSATPTNPLLREHLEHFQALLEKANDLVDRLMLADEDLASEGGATEVAVTPSAGNGTPPSGNAARRQLTYRLAQQRSGSAVATPRRQAAALPMNALTPNTPGDAERGTTVVTPLPSAPSLDPELAALFPATAARLARPYAHIEQSPDAVNSLLSSAVMAVPQLAKGADYILSKGSTPLSESPVVSAANMPIAAARSSHRASVPTLPTPAQSVALATPLALVASLLAEAHSRMEFQSLEEQRGADRILSAVLDEHFAHVLGTPRGFLTPPRGSVVRVGAAAGAMPAAAGAELMTPVPAPLLAQLQDTPQHGASAAGQANLSGVFSRAYAAASEAKATEATHAQDQQPSAPVAATAPVVPVAQWPECEGPPLAAVSQVLRRASGDGAKQQLQEPPSQERHEEMNVFLAGVMQQRADILTSALDHVHRVGVLSAQPPPSTEAAPLSGMPAAGNGTEAMLPTDLQELPMPTAPTNIAASAVASSANIEAYLPNSAIPDASGGLTLMPQPLMPYQEIDSDSLPSYNVSTAGSAFQPELSANWSHDPSRRTTNAFPMDSASPQLASRVSSVVAVTGTETRQFSAGAPAARRATSDSVIPSMTSAVATSTTAEPAMAAEARGGYDLSHLIDDDDGPLSAGLSSVFQRSPAATEPPNLEAVYDGSNASASGGVCTLKSPSSRDGHILATPVPPHETALRYNPVFDPTGKSLGGCATGTAFGAAAAAAAIADLSRSFGDGGGVAAAANGMTTLHHETAYTPLALAAGEVSDGGAGGLESSLHARLRSAGGTTTAVLIPNPMYDFPADSDHPSRGSMLATAAAVVAKAKAVFTSDGGLTDVTMSLDFEEISREAAAVVDTLSAHGSAETADPLGGGAAAVPSTANMQAAANAPDPTPTMVPSSPMAAMDAKQPPSKPSAAVMPGNKRHMGDMVAAVVRRFESGIVSVPAATPEGVAVAATSEATTLPAQQPSVDGVELIASIPHTSSTGRSVDWQSIALSTNSEAGAHARQASGSVVPSAPTLLPSRGSLLSLGSSTGFVAHEAASTVHTREWVPTGGSQEIREEIPAAPVKDNLAESNDQLAAERREPVKEQQEAAAAESHISGDPPATKSLRPGGRPEVSSGAAAARTSPSPVRVTHRAGAAAVSAGLSAGGIGAGGRATSNSSGVAARKQQPRVQGGTAAGASPRANTRQPSPARALGVISGSGAAAGSPGGTRPAAVSPTASGGNSNITAGRRSTQSPLRPAPASRVNRASTPVSRSAVGSAGGAAAGQQQQQPAGPSRWRG